VQRYDLLTDDAGKVTKTGFKLLLRIVGGYYKKGSML